MKLILPDKSVRILDLPPLALETILIDEGVNPLEVMASRSGVLISDDTVVGIDDEVRLLLIAHGG